MIKSMFYEDDRYQYYETNELYVIVIKTKSDTDWTFYYQTLQNPSNDLDKKLKNELEKHIARNKFREQLSIVLADNE